MPENYFPVSFQQVEIIINVENCNIQSFVILDANWGVLIVYYNFNPCDIFEKRTSITQIFNQNFNWTRKINGGHKFSKIKVPKTSSHFRNRLKFGKISGKDLAYEYEN